MKEGKMMRKAILYISLYLLTVSSPLYSDANTMEAPSPGQAVYKSMERVEIGNMQLAGINLSSFSFYEIYQYAIIKQNILFVFGKKESGKFELARIRLDSQRYSSVSHYSADVRQTIPKVKFAVFYINKIKNLSPFIMIEQSWKNKKSIHVFYSKSENSFDIIKTVNVSLDSKIFLSDANNDGYTDILVWKGDDPKMSKQKEMRILVFDNHKKNFSNLEILRGLIEIFKYGFL